MPRRLSDALIANRKPLLWLVLTYIPVGMGAGYIGFWLFHTWVLGFIVAAVYMLGFIFIWARMLMHVRNSE
jgi:hypothetical protein